MQQAQRLTVQAELAQHLLQQWFRNLATVWRFSEIYRSRTCGTLRYPRRADSSPKQPQHLLRPMAPRLPPATMRLPTVT